VLTKEVYSEEKNIASGPGNVEGRGEEVGRGRREPEEGGAQETYCGLTRNYISANIEILRAGPTKRARSK
jgi:hypothetical protein